MGLKKTTFTSIATIGDFDDRETTVLYSGENREVALNAIKNFDTLQKGTCELQKWDDGKHVDTHHFVVKAAWTFEDRA